MNISEQALELYGIPPKDIKGRYVLGCGICIDVDVFDRFMAAEVENLPDEDLKWKNWPKLTKIWYEFYRRKYSGDRSDRILDFGCGSCFGVFVARQLGYTSIFPFDRNSVDYRSYFTALRVPTVWTYFKNELPFEDNFFKAAVSRLVLGNWREGVGDGYQDITHSDPVEEDKFRACELSRVIKPGGVIYISNKGRYKQFLVNLKESDSMRYFTQKSITLVSWR
ncbi:MAG: hypothetical protein WC341_16920 [Bacteroidales bacterium]|jgi:SAM-dependent methyltransferase